MQIANRGCEERREEGLKSQLRVQDPGQRQHNQQRQFVIHSKLQEALKTERLKCRRDERAAGQIPEQSPKPASPTMSWDCTEHSTGSQAELSPTAPLKGTAKPRAGSSL